MATKTLKTIIQLRRDTSENYNKIADSYVPLKGEVVFVDTPSDGLRAKVGDGVSKYSELGYSDQYIREAVNNKIIRGYYFNNKFYTDSTYSVEVYKSVESLYIDSITKTIYNYDGEDFICVNYTLPTASDAVAGIAKLYSGAGQNTDGSMTQKSITDGVNSIKLEVDSADSECLVLDLPWD